MKSPERGHASNAAEPDSSSAVERAETGPNRSLTAEFQLWVLAFIWGANFTVIKVAFEFVSPLGFNALRFPLAVAVLVVGLVLRRSPLPRRSDLGLIVLLGVLGHVGYQLCFIIGLEATTAGNSSILLATSPLWTAVLAGTLGGERIPAHLWAGMAATLLGIVLVVLGGSTNNLLLARDTLKGDVLMLIAALLWAGYTVGGQPLVERYGALPVTTWTVAVGMVGIVAFGAGSLDVELLTTLPARVWLAILYAGALGIGLAYLIWYAGVKVLGSTRTALYSNVIPVVALAVAWVWLGETPTIVQLAGAALVLAGVGWARRPERAA